MDRARGGLLSKTGINEEGVMQDENKVRRKEADSEESRRSLTGVKGGRKEIEKKRR